MDDFKGRISEGQRLSLGVGVGVGDAATDDRLLQLLLDPNDTAVTYETALALLARRDDRGVELILRAEVLADDNTSQWLGDAFATFRAESHGRDDDFLRSSLHAFAATSEDLRTAAQDLIDWLHL